MNGLDGARKCTHHRGAKKKKKKRMATSNATTTQVDCWYVTECGEFGDHANHHEHIYLVK